MISHRSFDWFLVNICIENKDLIIIYCLFKLKYHQLLNNNGQCYFLAPNGFQHTRYWMNQLHGSEFTDKMFHFCQHFRELNLNESEFSLIIPLHMCYSGKIFLFLLLILFKFFTFRFNY
jgi:hypothetical protein